MPREYRDFNRIDARLFKAFLAAAHSENFTTAAKNASMTQSGISQQIAKLEEQVGVSLFKRINKTVILTEAGKRLVHYIDQYLDGMDQLLESISDLTSTLKGRVTYAMPNSCLLSPHLAMMLEKRKKQPGIELNIMIASNEEVTSKVLKGDADFGFVTRKIASPGLKFTPYCLEEFVLVAGKDLAEQPISEKELINRPFITFPGFESYFNTWKREKLTNSTKCGIDQIKIIAEISQLDGVITLLKGNIGYSILPKHCVRSEINNRTIKAIEDIGKKIMVENQIYIVQLEEVQPNLRTSQVMTWFHEIIAQA